MSKLYKDKYAIGIYEINGEETCIALFDNVHQLATYLNRTISNTSTLIARTYKKVINNKKAFVEIDKRIYELALIEM